MIPRFRLFPLVRSLGPLTLVALVLSIDCTVSGGSISPDERFPYWEALNQPGNGMRSLGLSSAWKNLYATMASLPFTVLTRSREHGLRRDGLTTTTSMPSYVRPLHTVHTRPSHSVTHLSGTLSAKIQHFNLVPLSLRPSLVPVLYLSLIHI